MVGARVKMSLAALAIGIARNSPGRSGVITGESQNKSCWRVLWDGTTVPRSIHKSFVVPDSAVVQSW